LNSERYSARSWLWLFLAIAASIPALTFRVLGIFTGLHLEPASASLVFGLGIVGAAFLVAWACQVAQMDISQALALAVLALVAVLPEYAVDMVFAWKAGAHPLGECVGGAWVNGECVGGQFYDYRSYTAANMTGGNRLLIGIGWALVALLFWFRQKRALALERGILLELVFLGAATVYSFLIFFRKEIALWDAGVLIGLFGAYIWLSSRAETREPELIGPSAALGSLRKGPRRLATVLLFLYSALAILASAEPFADGLVELGKSLEIDEFILVQWVAPLASESPEILIAAIFTLQGNATAAMMALVSAKVNQWTLLVGCIPVVYSISLGDASALHLDPRQTEEFLLTAAQSLFAVILLLRLRIGWLGALTLFLLFASQLFIPSIHARYIYSFVYLGLAMLLLAMDGQRRAMVWYMVRGAVWHGDR
jgi:cation:H+ antiporter